ncbi:MocR-like pyridoxine biosynthesis transcription factor PdxR [Nocardiopsis aegyptia]|uniref:GntR family transcriptional regulator/MocR family aminotransferase n=1 Tax=Nocardiopsis aegyptia TaxID=220378 RepID=A0A7Z0ERP3_9ACTN|nr:PLP-dependent aminotransferase family protein [Nocardiopsis aegyptia]NYJ37040.1 GntR family transcriptional regulator/MocR family aminotransferase [Nocardiopsis aegyptia]
MTRHTTEPPVRLDRGAGVPLAAQLSDQLRAAMAEGVLIPGSRLPSSRALAAELGVSRTVVTEAYQQLYAEGWLDGRHGSGTFVAENAGPAPAAAVPRPLPPAHTSPGSVETVRWSRHEARRRGLVDLRPGAPWVRDHDLAAWRRAWRHAAEQPPDDDPDPHGLPRLRALLADHLRRARGIRVGPENVLVTRSTGNGLDLVGATLLGPGTRAGVEDPGYPRAAAVLGARGATTVPCPVDHDGIVVADLPRDLSVVYTTPAHQYPLGGRLPIPRRERLLAWARETGAMVIEDDYDSEFRYDVAPLPALYGLDPGHVVLLGTLSKTLSPDLGVGWLVAEPDLLRRVAEVRRSLSDRTSGPAQAATALLLERGDLDRHLRRMRREYARRRSVVKEFLGPYLTGDTAGLHVALPLPAEAVAPVVAEAAAHGLLVDDLARTTRGTAPVHGLVLGYGTAHPTDLRRGCRTLAGILARRVGDAGPV